MYQENGYSLLRCKLDRMRQELSVQVQCCGEADDIENETDHVNIHRK